MNNIRDIIFVSEEISEVPCSNCGGEVTEFSIPNDIWNAVVRKGSKETDNEYLCVWCFVNAFIQWFDCAGVNKC